MTQYRLNEPTAYGPVPGPPVNPSREELDMTTTENRVFSRMVVWRKSQYRIMRETYIDGSRSYIAQCPEHNGTMLTGLWLDLVDAQCPKYVQTARKKLESQS